MRVSWLNLHLWIPQRDVRKLIYRLLDSFDRVVVRYAHTGSLPDDTYVFQAFPYRCAKFGYVESIEWYCLTAKFISYDNICFYASERGYLNVIRWVLTTTKRIWPKTFKVAAQNGHLHILEWVIANNYHV